MPAHKKKHSSKKRISFRKIKGHGTYKAASSRKKKSSSKVHRKSASRGSVRGHGTYYEGKVKKMKKHYKKYNSFAKIGSGIGSMFGPVGSMAGHALGSAIGSIVGHGEYKVNSNTLAIPGTQIPSFDRNGKQCVRIRHREYCYDLLSSTAQFQGTPYSMNPGNAKLFPWLATQTASYQEYSWEGLIFEYRSESGMAVSSTNTSLGYVSLATDYDATNTTGFTSKITMDNAEFSSSGPPSANVLHIVECKRSETAINNLYTNTGFVPANADQRLYDIGILTVANGNQQANNNVLGSLWVSYDICLYKPIVGYSGTGQNWCHYSLSGTASTAAGQIVGISGTQTANYFGASNVLQHSGSTMNLTLTNNSLTFPENAPIGNYFIIANWAASGGATASTTGYAPAILPVNCNTIGLIGQNSGYDNVAAFSYESPTAVNIGSIHAVGLLGAGASVTFTGGGLFPNSATGTCCNMDLIVGQLPSYLV